MLAVPIDSQTAGTTPPQTRPTRSGWHYLAPCAVWCSWVVLFAGLLGFIAHFARNVPFSDDWDVLPWVSGERSVDASWLWAPYHEHRIPLPKLLWVVLARLTWYDVRAGMYLTGLLLGGLSAALIVAARRLRGKTVLADAFFPLALLHWGQHQNLLWDFGLQFTCSTVLAIILLIAIVSVRGYPSPRQNAAVGICLLGLPLCGANGLLLVPLPAVWLMGAGVAHWRSGRRSGGAVWLALGGMALGLVAVSLLSGTGVGSHPVSPGNTATVQTACQFLVMSVGPGGEIGLPVSAMILLLLAWCALAVVTALRRPDERWRAWGMLCYLAAFLALGLAVGWGRAGAGGITAKYGTRFVTLAVPLLCWCYFAAQVPPVRVGLLQRVPPALCLLLLALLPLNAWEGVHHGEAQTRMLSGIEANLRKGMSPQEIAQQWTDQVYPPGGAMDYVRERLEWLRRTSQGPYKGRED